MRTVRSCVLLSPPGTGIVMAVLLHLLCALTPSSAAPTSVRFIEDFERDDPLDAWRLRQVDATIEVGADSAGAAVPFLAASEASKPDQRLRLIYLKWHAGQNRWPSARLLYEDGLFDVEDWTGYESLKFEAWNGHSRAVLMKIRIDDRDGDRSIQLISVPPKKWTTCTLVLSDLRAHTDLDEIRLLDFYMTQPQRDYELVIDDIRLETGPLRLTKRELTVDPFGRGFHAKIIFNRVANVSMELVAEQKGAVVRRFAGSGSQVIWQSTGKRLSPGSYRLRVTTESGDEEPVDVGSFAVGPEAPELVAWLEPPTQKVRLDSWPRAGRPVYNLLDTAPDDLEPARLQMVRNEHEALQLVVLGPSRTSVDINIESLRHVGVPGVEGDELPATDITTLQVGYVKTAKPSEYDVESAGWWPDPLLPKTRMAALPDESMPIWISVHSRKERSPGLYHGFITLNLSSEADSSISWQLPFEVEIHPSTLPDTTTVRTAFSLRRFMLDRVYGKSRARQMYRPYSKFVAAHRLNVTDLYRRSSPPLYEVAGPARAGLLNAFNLMQVNADDADSVALEKLGARLDPYVRQLRRAGIADRAYIYGFDEVASDQFEQLRHVFEFLKRRYPEIRTMTTALDRSFGLETGLAPFVDIWVPSMAVYDEDAAALARQSGEEVWWYIYVSPPQPFANWFVEYPALEARLLWWMTYQKGVSGFLYYYLNRWPNQIAPMSLDREDNRIDWNPASFGTANGDGCLFYPGPQGPITTIRFECIRDGIEDSELLHMLTEGSADGGEAATQLCAILAQSLTNYTTDSNLLAQTRQQLIMQLEEGR